jgi:spore germination protein KB
MLVTIYLFISKLNEEKSFAGILENCFGKVIGKAIGLLYAFGFLHLAAMHINGFGEFMITVSYVDVPLYILIGVMILICVYVVRSGLETIGRLSELFAIITPLSVLLVFFSITTIGNYTGFEPMLLEVAPIIKGGVASAVTVYGDFIAFLMILPDTNNEKGRFKSIYITMIAIGLTVMSIVTRNIMLLGPELLGYFSYPSSVAAQLIPGISIDPIIDINLVIGGGARVVVYLYAATKMTAEVFEFEDYKPLVCAFAVFVLVAAYWVFPSSIEASKWSDSISSIIYCVPSKIILPVIILIISIVKKNQKPKAEIIE